MKKEIDSVRTQKIRDASIPLDGSDYGKTGMQKIITTVGNVGTIVKRIKLYNELIVNVI